MNCDCSEAIWSFLGAVLPSSDSAHVAVLAAAIGELPEGAMSPPCIEAREGFVAKLQQHQPTGGAPAPALA